MKTEQLIKKDCATGTYENMYPVTLIPSVKDPITGESLDKILEQFNSLYLVLKDRSRTLTRLQVPDNMRRRGLWITYISYNDNIITERYEGEDFSDTAWGDSHNWKPYISDDMISKVIEEKLSWYKA